MGLSQDNWHKHHNTGGKRKPYHKKQKYEQGCPTINTKMGPCPIHTVQIWGVNKKNHALKLDVGNFFWGSDCCTCQTRIIDVVYNAFNKELVHTKTLVKNCIMLIDNAPYPKWYEPCYAPPLGYKKGDKLMPKEEEIKKKLKKFKRNMMKGKKCQNQQFSRGAVPAGQASCTHHFKNRPVWPS